jgi:hypothetical protein
MPPFGPSERVVILGAGATVGASFVEPGGVRPPLNADFFTQLQRVGTKHQKVVRDVVRDVVDLFGPNFSLTLEDYFSQLESMIDATRLAPKGVAKLTGADLQTRRDRLMKALAAVLEASTDDAIRRQSGCTLHQELVRHLDPRDTIISFNYDCVMDDALRRAGDGKWTARYGYAFSKPSRVAPIGDAFWSHSNPAKSASGSVYLLKLHGSLNWQLPPKTKPDGEVTLKQRLHQQRGTPRFTIIPPGWTKRERDEPIFEDLWKKAERALRTAKCIAVVGFSFTPTDLHVEAVVRLAAARSSGSLKTLVIANPSEVDRRRIRSVFSKQLEKGTVVRQYDSFEQFVDALPDCLA